MPIKARKCFVALSPSRWVSRVFLTCDNMLAVEYRHGQHVKKIAPHGPGAYVGTGGVPHVCCLYPGTQGNWAEALYVMAQTWSYGGEWVHQFLYKKFGYTLIAPPKECGNCDTQCTLAINPVNPKAGEVVTISCTVTNTDGSPTKGEAPHGALTFRIDGQKAGTVVLPANGTDTRNSGNVSITWTASCEPQATHVIDADYTPADAEFTGTGCQASVEVSNCGGTVMLPCCPNVALPKTVYATLSNPVAGCACLVGTYQLNWDDSKQAWMSAVGNWCGIPNSQIGVFCGSGGFYLDFFEDGYGIDSSGFLGTLSCNPLTLTGQCYFDFPPCDGGVLATVTE